jgi:glycosyltransferase involved in cell wall biosynthesis
MKRTILFLSTYPYAQPRHGGEIRLAHIAAAFARADWDVRGIAVYDEKGYSRGNVGRHDLPFPSDQSWREFNGRLVPLIDDLLSGRYAESDVGGFPAVTRALPRRIDAIHVEQPWLWGLARKIRDRRRDDHIVLVYGSQNIEAPLKRQILAASGITRADDVIQAIDTLERRAAREADLTLAVTHAEGETLSTYGAMRQILAPNGIEPWEALELDLERWRGRLPRAPWILYIASAHPPNFTGFTQIVGESLGFLPPDSRLVVAGTVGEHVYRVLSDTRWHALNSSRLQLLFVLPERDLAAVKQLANVFILPIAHGGGSSLKTAEAIYSGSYVVGSSAAFRGYEDWLHLPELTVADEPDAFRAAVQAAFLKPAPASKISKDAAREALRWDNCLAQIPARVEQLVREQRAI